MPPSPRESVIPAPRVGRFSGFALADVRPGEGVLVAGAALVLGGIVAAHVLLETARDALFLTKLGASDLALVYLAMAVLGLFTARADRMVSRAFGRKYALVLGLMGAATGTMAFHAATIDGRVAFALYLWAGVITTLLTVQFWLSVAGRFTPTQARRLFGLVSGGGVLGAVLGASLGALLAERLPIKSLLAASAALHLGTAWLVTMGPRAEEVEPPRRVDMRRELGALRGNGYLVRVGLLLQLATATLLVVDYSFKTVMASRFTASELGVHLARYYAVMNGLALVVQLFVTMHVLQRVGTILSLTLLPLALVFGGALGSGYGAMLLFVLIAKGADGALRFSLHRASTELLFLPLSPDERSRAKPLLDSVLARITQAIVAGLLLFAGRAGLLGQRSLGFVVVGMASVWIFLAWSLRKPYLERFRAALGRPLAREGVRLTQLSLDSMPILIEALSSPDENRVLGAMGLFHDGGRDNLIPALVLYHPSPRVLTRALEILPRPGRSDWIPLAERLLAHDDERVQLAAIRALGATGRLETLRLESFERAPTLRAAAAFFLADRAGAPEAHPALQSFLEPGADPTSTLALVTTIAQLGSETWADVVERLATLERPDLDGALPLAMARTRDPRFVPRLVRRLGRRHGRAEARDALVSFGEVALVALEKALYDRNEPDAVRLHIPRAISRFPERRAGELLVDALLGDLPGAIRFKALRGLGRLVERGAHTPTSEDILPLVERDARKIARIRLYLGVLRARKPEATLSSSLFFAFLEDKERQALERALRQLQLLHPREDMKKVYYAVVSKSPTSRAAAAEILEVTSLGYDESLRKLLRLAAEPHSETTPLDRYALALEVPIPSELEVLEETMRDRDPYVAALASSYAMELDYEELEPVLERARVNDSWLPRALAPVMS